MKPNPYNGLQRLHSPHWDILSNHTSTHDASRPPAPYNSIVHPSNMEDMPVDQDQPPPTQPAEAEAPSTSTTPPCPLSGKLSNPLQLRYPYIIEIRSQRAEASLRKVCS